jgi:hypothetical protein
MSAPVVTQADREFASRWASLPQDHRPLARDAARHRTATEAAYREREAALVEALDEARRQLEYMDERSPSGTTPAVLARINALLARATASDAPYDPLDDIDPAWADAR